MSWLVRIVINGLALLVADQFIASIEINGFGAALIAALILGIINSIIRPILIFLTLPITVVSLGLFILVINALTFGLTAALVDGFTVTNFSGAFFGAIITSIVSWIMNSLAKDKD